MVYMFGEIPRDDDENPVFLYLTEIDECVIINVVENDSRYTFGHISPDGGLVRHFLPEWTSFDRDNTGRAIISMG